MHMQHILRAHCIDVAWDCAVNASFTPSGATISHILYATTLAASHALSPDLMLRNSAEPADGKHTELQHGKISSSLSRTDYTAHHSQTTRRASKPRVGARWSHASGNGLPLSSIRKHCLQQRYTLQTEQPYEERGKIGRASCRERV